MGLFGKLFDKKECSICGGEIGLLGNRKLEDGNCCKTCVKKLSPWFEERRNSTVAQIREQLAYRAKNEENLATFTVSRVIGDYNKIYIEETNGVPARFFVTSAGNYMDVNPDIIPFKDVLSCVTDIEAREEEMKRDDGKGNSVSYNPPRYKVHHNFFIEMAIDNNPYFNKIRFRLNSSVVTLEVMGSTGLFGGSIFGGNRSVSLSSGLSDARNRQRYHEYEAMCQQIEETVKESKLVAATVAAVASQKTAAAGPKFCPECGAPVTGGKFCSECGNRFQ